MTLDRELAAYLAADTAPLTPTDTHTLTLSLQQDFGLDAELSCIGHDKSQCWLVCHWEEVGLLEFLEDYTGPEIVLSTLKVRAEFDSDGYAETVNAHHIGSGEPQADIYRGAE